MKGTVSAVAFTSLSLMLSFSPCFAQDLFSAPMSESQAQEAAPTPPQGQQAAAENLGAPNDTHLRLTNDGASVSPGNAIVLNYRTAPNSMCSIKAENTDVVIDDENSKIADRYGRVSWRVSIPKTYTGNDMPVEVSTSRYGSQQTIETRIPVRVAVVKKGVKM